MRRTRVRVVEDALDANNTIAGANADDFERSDVTVVNLMSAPGAGKTTLLERALEGIVNEDPPALRVGVLEGDVINKVDLLEHLDFEVDRLEANIRQVNHDATVMRVSAKTGEGVDEFRAWLKALPARVAAEAHAREHDHDHAEQQLATA